MYASVWLIAAVFCLLQLSCVSATYIAAKNVGFFGRTMPLADGSVKFDWPLVEAHVSFTGASELAVYADDTGSSEFSVFVLPNTLTPVSILTLGSGHPANTSFTVLTGLNPAHTYNVTLRKRTEPLVGAVRFYGFELSPSASSSFLQTDSYINSNSDGQRYIEAIGDSISCGYGDLGQSPCPFTPQTEDAGVTYLQQFADAHSAHVHLQCWSGRGLVRNYNDSHPESVEPFPVIYPRTLATDATTQWPFLGYAPDLVTINLGTNDYSTQGAPPADVFVDAYLKLFAFVRSKYGSQPFIFALCGPMISDPCCQYVQQAVAKAQSQDSRVVYVDMHKGIFVGPQDVGCNGHPSQKAHAKMAGLLSEAAHQYLGW
jgi:lysophospholipase L1-like esterase